VAGSRGAANQSLYRARVLLDCWDTARDASRFPETVLADAFMPAVLEHLREAYGYFLLAVAGVEDLRASVSIPSSTADLPSPEPGRSTAPELREFALLESEGWLGDLIRSVEGAGETIVTTAPDLLGSDRAAPGFPVAESLWRRLGDIMQRMDDSLAEC
jgi:hypothetical protein